MLKAEWICDAIVEIRLDQNPVLGLALLLTNSLALGKSLKLSALSICTTVICEDRMNYILKNFWKINVSYATYIIVIFDGDNMLQNIRENWGELCKFSIFIMLLINKMPSTLPPWVIILDKAQQKFMEKIKFNYEL